MRPINPFRVRAWNLNEKYRVKRVQAHNILHQQPMWVKHPSVIQFDTQNICQLSCIYCNPTHIYNTEHGRLPLKTIDYVLRYVRDKHWFINYACPFMNGDPLLELRLPRIAEMIKSYLHSRVLIFTNGVAYENRHMLLSPYIDTIHFTVSAATKETYLRVHGSDEFANAFKTIRWFRDRKQRHQRIIMVFVQCRENTHELEDWKELFYGFDQIVRPLFEGKEKPQSILAKGNLTTEQLFSHASHQFFPDDRTYDNYQPCPCWDSLNISWKGEIMQCMDLPYQYHWGSVYENDIEQVWNRRNLLGTRHEACRTCGMKNPESDEPFSRWIWSEQGARQ